MILILCSLMKYPAAELRGIKFSLTHPSVPTITLERDYHPAVSSPMPDKREVQEMSSEKVRCEKIHGCLF